jgi:hypothetical protein
MMSVADRFWSKVDRRGPNECWEWQTHRDRAGYGKFCISTGRNERAHRAAWLLTKGSLPGGVYVLHSCDNPPCCNPSHLRLGSHADNMADKVARNRCRPPRGEVCVTAKLTAEDVHDIRCAAETLPVSARSVARAYGISHMHLRRILDRKAWAHL